MIVDKIENAHLYTGLSDRIARAFEILKDKKIFQKTDGRCEFDGDNIYYIVQHYTTKPMEQGKLEAHRKYIDIQFVADGRELLGFSHIDNLETEIPYNKEKDIMFYKVPEKISTVKLTAGMFCILFPHDAHMPKCQLKSPSNVLKIVVKVKIDDR